MCLSAQNPTWLPYWLTLLSAGAAIKRWPTASSYGNIDIDLQNLQNIIYQKSLIKNSNRANFLR